MQIINISSKTICFYLKQTRVCINMGGKVEDGGLWVVGWGLRFVGCAL